MLKLASIALIPVLAATFYPQVETPQVAVPRVTWAQVQVQEEDQTFLETLRAEDREKALIQNLAAQQADQEFLVNLQEEDLIPVRKAIPVDRSIPDDPWADAVREGHEVRRAIPVNQPTMITRSAANPSTSLASDTGRRNALQQNFVTMVGQESEVRRAVAGNRQRSSITIYGDQMVVRMATASSR